MRQMALFLLIPCVMWWASCSSSDAEPDGGVIQPSVDGGQTSFEDGAAATDATARDAAEPDSSEPGEDLCSCLAKQPRQATCQQQATSCSQDSDCCLPASTIPCGTFGNSFSCVQGSCRRAGCQDKSECVAYAQAIHQDNAQDWDCLEGTCPGDLDFCSVAVPSCSKDSDCCSPGDSNPCGAYPNRWHCDQGKCVYDGCSSDNECVAWAQSIGSPLADSFICQPYACFDIGYCALKPAPCSTPSDCCSPSSLVPCGTYSNRYRCENGGCVLDRCKDHQDCQSYASALSLPDAADYSCVEN